MTDPGTPLSGTVTVAATASDARSAVASVDIQRAPNGSSTWTTICTDNVAPYSCSWVTTGVTDGTYQLRAVATDTAGYSATSTSVTTTVVNSATVTLTPVDGVVRGSVPLSLTVTGNAGATVTNRFEYAVADASPQTWTTIPGCGNATGTTRSCTWVTSGAETYDVRAVAVIGSQTFYDTETDVLVDNLVPTAALTVPAGTLRGTVDLTATATDADSGVETVSFEYKLSTAGTWSVCGVADDDPFSCALNTTPLTNGGSYNFRAVVTDVAGNVTTTATQTRTVDNSAPSVSISSPTNGSTIAGTVTITAAGNAVQGINNVRIEARAGTTGTFAVVCTDNVAPYTCTYNTTTVPNGTYQIQAVLTPTSGAAVTSAVVTVTVDNTPLKAQDVQTTNVTTANRPAVGDRVVLTYSSVVNLASIKAGWTGASTPVTLTFKDKNVTGAAISGYDRMEMTGANLGQVAFVQNFVPANRTVVVNGSTMTATTATVGGVQVTVVTITLGTPASSLSTASTNGAMRWTPSTAATSLAGLACSSAIATETGTNDRDF
ncbi:MAG: Ig-like domain-containing protein [Nocardioides sp.]